MLYEEPMLEVSKIEVEDVIRTSPEGDHDATNPGEDQSGASGSWLPTNQ